MDDTSEDLLQQAELICQQSRFKHTLLRHLNIPHHAQHHDGLHGELIMDIHPDDQMLLHSLHHHQSAELALSQYFSISLQQFNAARQIMQACFGSGFDHVKVLDFACGYGRLLRFMSMLIPSENLWASEIQPEALEFTRSTFGVQGVLSTADPQDFEVEERFDFIWVASLFSHLPDDLFQAWLAKLCTLLTPRGVLCFSARGSELMPVSESYVQGWIDKNLGLGHGYSRLPRALANEQDLYLLGKDPDRELPAIDEFDKGLWGCVDRLDLDQNNILKLEGWAASMRPVSLANVSLDRVALDRGALDRVEVRIDGEANSVQPDIERPDVALSFAEPGILKSGWAFRQKIEASASAPYIEVSAYSKEGDSALLFAGTLQKTGKKPRLNKRALGVTLALAVLMLLLLFGTRKDEQLTVPDLPTVVPEQTVIVSRLELPSLADGDYDWIAARIFENEAASQVRYLTFWGEGEDFPSFGIGHFIWFPANVDAPFDEQFPDMVAYVSQRAASDQPLPEWMQKQLPFDAPWSSKDVFDKAWSSDEMTALREWLQATARWQARFIVVTFERRWQALEIPLDRKVQMTALLQQLAGSAPGLFAIIDYYNFKGLGVNPRERYQGQGWGLIQVLQAMPASQLAIDPESGGLPIDDAALVAQFSQAAAERLSLRVELAPPERNEKRWLPGWLKRLQAYLTVSETVTE